MISILNSWGGCFLHPGLHGAFDASSLPTMYAEMGSKSDCPLQEVIDSKGCKWVLIAHEGPVPVGACVS